VADEQGKKMRYLKKFDRWEIWIEDRVLGKEEPDQMAQRLKGEARSNSLLA
jgi:hypothetical protein